MIEPLLSVLVQILRELLKVITLHLVGTSRTGIHALHAGARSVSLGLTVVHRLWLLLVEVGILVLHRLILVRCLLNDLLHSFACQLLLCHLSFQVAWSFLNLMRSDASL